MAQKLLSVYIGNNRIRVCEMIKNSAKNVILNSAVELPTPAGSIEDGLLTDVESLAKVIGEVIKDKDMKAKRLVFCIASKKIATKEILVPFMKKPHKIQEIVDACASDYFPMSNVEDYVYAYSVLERVVIEDMKKLRISAIATPKNMVQSYYELAEALGMPIESIDYFGHSILELLKLQTGERAEMIIQIEKNITVVNIMSGDTLVLQRNIPFGQGAVEEALMDLKGIRQDDAAMILGDAAAIQRRLTAEEYEEVVSYLVNSIIRVVDYYQENKGAVQIEGIRLFGEECEIALFDTYLEEALGLPVEYINKLEGVTIRNSIALQGMQAQSYLANISAVLNPAGIALAADSEEKAKKSELHGYLVGLYIATGIVVVALLAVSARYFILKYQYNEVVEKVSKLEYAEKLYDEYISLKQTYEVLDEFDATTKNANEELYAFLLEMENRMPSHTEFETVSATDGKLNITGRVHGNKDELAALVIQMKESPLIADVFISSITDYYTLVGDLYESSEFTIDCTLVTKEVTENQTGEETADEANTEG